MNKLQQDLSGGPVAQDYGTVLGTPFKVFLSNGVETKPDKKTGKMKTEIKDLPGLIASVVQSRVLHPRKLSGDDLKYIRSALGMRSNAIAEILEITPEHYSRCETGVKTLSSSVEKFYRMYAFLQAACKNKALHDCMKESDQESFEAPTPEEAEEAEEAIVAFRSVFIDMKIETFHNAGEELVFSFIRRPRRASSQRSDRGKDGKWKRQPPKLKAA